MFSWAVVVLLPGHINPVFSKDSFQEYVFYSLNCGSFLLLSLFSVVVVCFEAGSHFVVQALAAFLPHLSECWIIGVSHHVSLHAGQDTWWQQYKKESSSWAPCVRIYPSWRGSMAAAVWEGMPTVWPQRTALQSWFSLPLRGSGNQTQVTRLARQMLLPTKPFDPIFSHFLKLHLSFVVRSTYWDRGEICRSLFSPSTNHHKN